MPISISLYSEIIETNASLRNRSDFAVTSALIRELTEFDRSCSLVCRGFATIGTMSEVRRGGKYKRGE